MNRIAIVVGLFFALAVTGYAIQRGLFVGSSTVERAGYWKKECRYLVASGIHRTYVGGWYTPQASDEADYCKLFMD